MVVTSCVFTLRGRQEWCQKSVSPYIMFWIIYPVKFSLIRVLNSQYRDDYVKLTHLYWLLIKAEELSLIFSPTSGTKWTKLFRGFMTPLMTACPSHSGMGVRRTRHSLQICSQSSDEKTPCWMLAGQDLRKRWCLKTQVGGTCSFDRSLCPWGWVRFVTWVPAIPCRPWLKRLMLPHLSSEENKPHS